MRYIKIMHVSALIYMSIVFLLIYAYKLGNHGLTDELNPIMRKSVKLYKELRIMFLRSEDITSHSKTEINANKLPNYYSRYKYMNRNDSLPGELGKAVPTMANETRAVEAAMRKFGANTVISDKIALDRSLTDFRLPGCKNTSYSSSLPSASVIILFVDEAPSLILRTVHSVVNRSPPQLIHEIILVDDHSTNVELGITLDSYINRTWPDLKITILRLKTRHGLMRARNSGARQASGDIIIVLDGHMEVNSGWLEPLLQRLKEKPMSLVTPTTTTIDKKTLRFYPPTKRGYNYPTFDWGMSFSWGTVPASSDKRKTKTEPIGTPAMVGCVFAMWRKRFFELGAFDEGMETWGAENVELPIRVWLCGGTVEQIPCSITGHVFRQHGPWKWIKGGGVLGKNTKRFVEVWLDEKYKNFFYYYKPVFKAITLTNISERLALRQRLRCKPFEWLLKTLSEKLFIPLLQAHAYGQVKNVGVQKCLQEFRSQVILVSCDQSFHFDTRVFVWSKRGEIRRESSCIHGKKFDGEILSLRGCSDEKALDWIHSNVTMLKLTYLREKTGEIRQRSRPLCLDGENLNSKQEVLVRNCSGTVTQKWSFEFYL